MKDFNAGFSKLSEHPLLENMELVAVLLAVCIKNQRPPLLEWEADVSEEFSWLQQFYFFMPELQMLPQSIFLLHSPSLFVYIHCKLSLLLPSQCWHIQYLKLFLNQCGEQPPSVCLFPLLQAKELFQRPSVGDSPPRWCQWRRERLRKREVKLWQGPFLSIPASDLVSCLALRFATLTGSLFGAERREEAQLAALCAHAALDGPLCCITLCTAVKGGWKAAVILLSSTLPTLTALPVPSL